MATLETESEMWRQVVGVGLQVQTEIIEESRVTMRLVGNRDIRAFVKRPAFDLSFIEIKKRKKPVA